MKTRYTVVMTLFLLLSTWSVCSAALNEKTWMVDGAEREALVWMPETTNNPAPPLVFVFHGHGGNMKNGARAFRIHELWPEAMVVYMQGLPTPGQLTDPEGKRNGWNSNPNDAANRDLDFFDAVYASFSDQTDTNRVFSTGHSNGGGFTYCLWAARGELFAAVAPSAAVSGRFVGQLSPLPVLHVAGEKDSLVKYEWQKKMMKAVRHANGCAEIGEPWETIGTLEGTLYSSDQGAPFVSLIHPGSHAFPSEAPVLMVRFFKEHTK